MIRPPAAPAAFLSESQTRRRMSMLNADWKRPSPRLRQARHLQALAPAVLLAIGLGGVLAINSLTAPALAAARALLAGARLDVMLQCRLGAWGYLERADGLLIRCGRSVRRVS